jgi:hypothetical protein
LLFLCCYAKCRHAECRGACLVIIPIGLSQPKCKYRNGKGSIWQTGDFSIQLPFSLLAPEKKFFETNQSNKIMFFSNTLGTQYNGTQHNGTQYNCIQHKGIQHNDTQHTGTQHNGIQHYNK